MSVIEILAGPVIGAVIGYFTNYIAVKMLFRPLKPVKIGDGPFLLPRGSFRKGSPGWQKLWEKQWEKSSLPGKTLGKCFCPGK